MLQPDEIKCCSKCWHSPATPCHDIIECLDKGPACHKDSECIEKIERQKLYFRRDITYKAVIYVGTGSCGISAGALKVKETIYQILEKLNINADVIETGCIGLCSFEPIVDVQLPGRTRVVYGNVKPDDVLKVFYHTGLVSEEIVPGHFEDHIKNLRVSHSERSEESMQSLRQKGIIELFEKSTNEKNSSVQFQEFQALCYDQNNSFDEVKIIGQYRNKHHNPYKDITFLDELPFFKNQTKLITGNCGVCDPVDIKEYIARDGFKALAGILKSNTHQELCEIIESAGLRDRGSSGKSTGNRYKEVLHSDRKDVVLVCNSEKLIPGSFIDIVLLESDPFRIIEGIALAAYAAGLNKAVLLVRSTFQTAIKRFEIALAEAKHFGFIGSNILDSSNDLDISVKRIPGSIISQEDTSIINFLNGQRGISQKHPNCVNGITGQYKYILNEHIETLANLSNIVLYGPDGFKSVGTAESAGTRAFLIKGSSNITGYIEAGMDCNVKTIIDDICSGIANGKSLKAIQIGGPFGGFLDAKGVNISISYEGLVSSNIRTDTGSILIMDEDVCMVDIAEYLMDFVYKESCGICIPCREGGKRIYEILGRMKAGRKNDDEITRLDMFHSFLHLEKLIDVMKISSACSYGYNSPSPVTNLMNLFRDEFETHVYENECPANICEIQ